MVFVAFIHVFGVDSEVSADEAFAIGKEAATAAQKDIRTTRTRASKAAATHKHTTVVQLPCDRRSCGPSGSSSQKLLPVVPAAPENNTPSSPYFLTRFIQASSARCPGAHSVGMILMMSGLCPTENFIVACVFAQSATAVAQPFL